MSMIYDVFKDEYIGEEETETIAPPERYIKIAEERENNERADGVEMPELRSAD